MEQEPTIQELLDLTQDRATLKETAERARAYAREHFSFEATAQPVLEWIDQLAPASDRDRSPRLGSLMASETYRVLRTLQGLGKVARERGLWEAITTLARGVMRRLKSCLGD